MEMVRVAEWQTLSIARSMGLTVAILLVWWKSYAELRECTVMALECKFDSYPEHNF